MKIESVRIENFRSFKDETIRLDRYACLVGPNGAGKSTVLAALNLFFRQYKDSKTDLTELVAEDFHHKNIHEPIRITVTFHALSPEAKQSLQDYVRQDKLIVSAVAEYDAKRQRADVRQVGTRLGMADFREFFDQMKAGATAAELKVIYAKLKDKHGELSAAATKPAMIEALRAFESARPHLCELIQSEDEFYGVTRGVNKLAQYLQWVFVSAAKDITEESHESRTSGLGQLLARTVRSKVDFAAKLAKLRDATRTGYQQIIDAEQSALDGLSNSIQLRLKGWAHPAVSARLLWTEDAESSVKIGEPWASIRLGERGFEGELARFGHGMQRCFMLTLLQELAGPASKDAPTLILGIEEPELYQHPPQARHLAGVLQQLASDGSQVIVCTHCPLFVPGDDFEAIRVVRDSGTPSCSSVLQLSYSALSSALGAAGKNVLKEQGMRAKLYPDLNPGLNEMFFCRVLVLVEGLEDVAYLSSYLTLTELLDEFRRFGCHIVPVYGKSRLIQPIAIAKRLQIPAFVVFDADTDSETKYAEAHRRDNAAVFSLMGYGGMDAMPSADLWQSDLVVWKENLARVVSSEIGASWSQHEAKAAAQYGHPGGLQKNPLAISYALEEAWRAGDRSKSLERLANALMEFARKA
jgi:energy-coupling factor transporter ATP-binding protein EcfA2